MNEIYIIAKLGDLILIINNGDLKRIGKETKPEVKCIKVDLRNKTINPAVELEKHLKFNPWEETTENKQHIFLQNLYLSFPKQDILKKLIEPLSKN